MGNKGLCINCVNSKTCIFTKEPPVLQCEEFSQGDYVAAKVRQAKVNRVIRQETTESE